MAITFVASSTTTYAARANTSIAVPTGKVNGDFLVMGIITGGAEAIDPTAPAGWTAIGATPISDIAASGFNVEMRLYSRVASSEPTSYAFTHASASSQAFMLCYRGVDNTTPFDTTQTVNFVNGAGNGVATATWTGLTTVTNGAWLVAIEHDWGDVAAASTPPTGMTERFDLDIIYAADEARPTAGATGNRTHVTSSTSPDSLWSAVLLALRPAGTGTTYSVSGTAASTSATSGAVNSLLPSAGSAASSTTSSGAVTSRLPSAGAAAVISASSGSVTSILPTAGSAAATSGSSGTVFIQFPASGTAVATSTSAGTVIIRYSASGTAVATSGSTGAVTSRLPAAGTATAVSGTSGAITSRRPVSGVAASTSSSSGDVTVTPGGSLSASGTAVSISGSSGTVGLRAAASGTVAVVSASTGSVTARLRAAGTAVVASVSTGEVNAIMVVSGVAVAVSGSQGNATLPGPPSGIVIRIGPDVITAIMIGSTPVNIRLG